MASTSESRRSYSVNFKLKAIELAEEKGKHFAAKALNVDRKRIRDWCQNKMKIKDQPKSKKRALGGGRKCKFPGLEESLLQWFSERRSAGVRVTGKALKREALRLHRLNGNQSFKASHGWFRRFQKRHSISFRRSTHVAQHARDITDSRVDKFLNFVIRMRRLRNYQNCEIANMDETPVWLEMPGKSTFASKGESEVRVTSTGHEKQKLTVTLGAYADGTKMSPLVHLPGVRPLAKHDIPSGIIVYMCGAGQKSWADETSIKFWLQKLWGMNNRRRRLLVWDAFRGHITSSVKEVVKSLYNTDMCVIPGGCTSKLQPADVSWNRPFKAKLSELYDEWLFSGVIEKTPKGNRRPPPKALLLRWIKAAWDGISPEVIRRSFKKCGITCELDGTEDHMFGQESDDDGNQDDFEGFSADDLEVSEMVHDAVQNVALSDSRLTCRF